MKILMVIDRHRRGGAQVAFMQQTELLLSAGHEVAHFSFPLEKAYIACPVRHYEALAFFPDYLLSHRGLKAWFYNKVFNKVFWLVNLFLLQQANAMRLRRAIVNFQPDVVHFHCGEELNDPALYSIPEACGVPSVFTVHSSWIVCPSSKLLKGGKTFCDADCARETDPGRSGHQHRCIPNGLTRAVLIHQFRKRIREKRFSRHIDLITVPSASLAGFIVRSGQIEPERVQVQYLPGNRQLLDYRPGFTQPPDRTYFFAAGRITTPKGFWILIHAFETLPDIPLVIAGEGPEKAAMEDYIRQHGLHHIQLVGWQTGEALWQTYRGSYATIITSIYPDNAPVFIQESLAHGKAVIGSKVGGIPEFVRPGESGLLFEPGDVDGLRQQVRALWADPEQARTLGRRGHEIYQAYFNAAYTSQQLMQSYELARQIHQARMSKRQAEATASA